MKYMWYYDVIWKLRGVSSNKVYRDVVITDNVT